MDALFPSLLFIATVALALSSLAIGLSISRKSGTPA